MLFAGCATNNGSSYTSINESETQAFIEQVEARSEDQKKLYFKRTEQQAHNLDYYNYAWLQPANKEQPCKILAMETKDNTGTPWWEEKQSTDQFWDGECSNGYAYGTGREFAKLPDERGLSSWLVTYSDAGEPPRVHMTVEYSQGVIVFKHVDDTHIAEQVFIRQETPTEKHVLNKVTLMSRKEAVSFGQYRDIGNDWAYATKKFAASGPYWKHTTNVNPTGPHSEFIGASDNESNPIGFVAGMHRVKDGQHFDYRTGSAPQRVTLPRSYIWELLVRKKEIGRAMDKAGSMLQDSYAALNRYQDRVCQGEVSVPWMDDQKYGQVCLENGDMAMLTPIMDEKLAEQETRLEKAQKRADRMAQQRARNQARAQQRAAAQANRDRATLSQSIQQFSRDMEEVNRDATQFSESYRNSSNSTGVTFGGGSETRTNCVTISNTIHCRSN